MQTYQFAQEWNDIRWGTVMPIAIMIGTKFVQLRARGICSFAVTDPARLKEQIPDPENLTLYVKSLLTQMITEMIGERSAEVSEVAELTTIDKMIIQTLQPRLESKFNAIGLTLKNVSIEAIESL
jgi:membrane protease subunit (stomatin/prohibitin family)